MQNVEQNSRFGATFTRTTLPHWLHAPFFNAFRNSAMHNSVQNSLSPFGVGSTYLRIDLLSLHQPQVLSVGDCAFDALLLMLLVGAFGVAGFTDLLPDLLCELSKFWGLKCGADAGNVLFSSDSAIDVICSDDFNGVTAVAAAAIVTASIDGVLVLTF